MATFVKLETIKNFCPISKMNLKGKTNKITKDKHFKAMEGGSWKEKQITKLKRKKIRIEIIIELKNGKFGNSMASTHSNLLPYIPRTGTHKPNLVWIFQKWLSIMKEVASKDTHRKMTRTLKGKITRGGFFSTCWLTTKAADFCVFPRKTPSQAASRIIYSIIHILNSMILSFYKTTIVRPRSHLHSLSHLTSYFVYSRQNFQLLKTLTIVTLL